MTPASPRLAKLSVPRTSGALVRGRLHRLLDDAIQHAAVWIAAGPGAGKSTLAATWAATRRGRVLWYRADEGDADLAAMFGYFRELARTTRRSAALPTYSARDLDRLDLFARAFFRAFFAVVPAASTLVVDDAHAVAGDAFAILLAAAIREAPQDVALLILSRHDPAGVLLELATTGPLRVLDAGELTFTAGEAATLLVDRMDERAARGLHARADGWVAGMLLLAQDARTRHASAADDRIASYFHDRVLASFDPLALRALAAVSLLPEVGRADVRRLGLGETAVELLEALRKHHTFVTRLGRQPASWRLHDLLRDALFARFESIGEPAWRDEVARRAADIAAERGLTREAVLLRLRAGDGAGARAIAERFARALVKSQRLAELDVVAAALGAAVVEASPALQLALGESAWQRHDARAAVQHYDRAYALCDAGPSPLRLLVAISALTALFEGWQDFEGTEQWIARAREHLPARDAVTDASDALRIDASCVLAMDAMWREQLGDYRALVRRTLARLTHPEPGLAADEVVAASSVLLEAAGYFLSDERLFQETVAATAPWLARPDLPPLAKARWLNAYAQLGRHWPSPGVKLPAPTAVACLELAVELAQAHGGQSSAFTGASFLTDLAVAENDLPAAQRRLEKLRELADPRHVAQATSLLGHEAAVLALAGEWSRAREVIDRTVELEERHRYPPSERWTHVLSRHRIAIASGDAAGAREGLLRDSAEYPPGMRRDFALILADVASAAQALRARGSIPPDTVERVIRAAHGRNWRGFGTLLAPVAARLCADALRLGIEPAFVRHVIRERRLRAPSPFDPHWPWPVRVQALSGLRVSVDDQPVTFGPRAQRKPLDVLKAIVAHGPAPVDSAVVLDALWPDAEGAAARAAFDMTVMRLRRLIGRDDAVALDAGHLALDPGCVWVDAWAFAHGAIDDYPGPLFGTDAVEPWWAAARERLHQRFLRRTLTRGLAHERAGESDAALAIFEAGLAQDPLAEDLYRGAIRCHLAAGRSADALRVFRRCREQLSIVLSVAPSAATAALVANLSSR
ncbi:MAG: hypothetical protein IT518_15940 [Burkholderiales bacterium]|nr:hypothetical protein [Burkholderiales bacterium]